MRNPNDLRNTLSQTTRQDVGEWRIAYVSHFGERHEIHHLAFSECVERSQALKKRGYRVTASQMPHARG